MKEKMCFECRLQLYPSAHFIQTNQLTFIFRYGTSSCLKECHLVHHKDPKRFLYQCKKKQFHNLN